MKPIKNYILYTPITVALVVVVMSVLSLFPPFHLFGTALKQTNIYSDVVSDSLIRELFGLEYITLDEHQDFDLSAFTDSLDVLIKEEGEQTHSIEDVSDEMVDYSVGQLYSKMLKEQLMGDSATHVRVAFMGDSFIEGDLFTMDMREILQSDFSGGGVGFVPITSAVSKYRVTVDHSFSDDWQSSCILEEREGHRYLLSGFEYVPSEGSWVEYGRSYYRANAGKIGSARLLFVNRGNLKITISINGGEPRVYEPASGDELQSLAISESISRIKYSFENCEGAVIYGALLDKVDDGRGVSLDAYSIRGNSGVYMGHMDRELSEQYNAIARYSLIVIQYGLNVSGQENYSYAKYGNQLLNLVERVKELYPDCAIALMGVSDRCEMRDGEAVTMPSVTALDKIQRQIAQRSNIIYYSTLQTMQRMGGMGVFVENKWASKDYTHINALGGRKLAEEVYSVLISR